MTSDKIVSVIGAGTMGAGIAQVAASHGWTVLLYDSTATIVESAIKGLAERLARQVEKGRMTGPDRDAILGRIKTIAVLPAVLPVALAIEAVVENLAVKKEIFAALDRATPPTAVLATNTSSLSVTRIAECVAVPGRVVGMHFFNPAPVMPLVEVIAGAQSDANCVQFAMATARAWGKTPVHAKDTPGFIVNRVARGFYLEALRLLGDGVAGVDETDRVMRALGSFKMGPFELMDLVGLDVNLAVSTSVWEQMGRPARFQSHEIQQNLVKQNQLGRKAGQGFYSYAGAAPLPACPVHRRSFELSPLLKDAMRHFCAKAGAQSAGVTEQYILSRILAAILNEAAWAWSEGVASREDIDTAMVLGTSYPRGPFAWAEAIGPRTVRGLLKALNAGVSDGRYEPAPMFKDAE